MQHDIVLKKLNLYSLTPRVRGGGCGEIFATMLLHFVISIKLVYIMIMFWKSWILTFWPHPLGFLRDGGVCWQNICYHVAAFCDSCKSDMQHWHVLKKFNFDLWTIFQGGGGGVEGGMWAKFLLPCCCILWFASIWYAICPCSEKVEFWPFDPIPLDSGGLFWQNICYHVAAFCDSVNLICNMTNSEKVEFWPVDSFGGGGAMGGGAGMRVCGHNVC